MSLPYHRGHLNNMNQRGNYSWGTRDQRVEEANRNLMEQDNDRRWVRSMRLLLLVANKSAEKHMFLCQQEELGAQVNMLKSVRIS
jgi:hypothetical protein